MTLQPPEYRYVAYIDEAGDPGLNRVSPRTPGGASEWLILSAVLAPAELESHIANWIDDLIKLMGSHQMRDLHFLKLNASRKSLACSFLASKNVRIFVVCSNKQNMEGYRNVNAEKVPSDNWFYCWLTRILLERVTHYVNTAALTRYGAAAKVKIEFSQRGGLRYSQLRAYYEWLKHRSSAGKVAVFTPFGEMQYATLHHDLLKVHPHTERAGLKFADIAASAFFRAVTPNAAGNCDTSFAKLLAPKIAYAPGSSLVAGYGVKLLPKWRVLDHFEVPEIKRAIFRFYGYPNHVWWQG